MRVNLYATLREMAGGKIVDVSVRPPTTVRAVLEAVTRERPILAEHVWKAPNEKYEHIRVFVNGRDVSVLPYGMETPLEAQDSLDVFPPVGGGASATR